MATFRSEDDAVEDLDIQPDATPSEAAAITAALSAHLSQRERTEESDDQPTWTGEKWRTSGRLAATTGRHLRIPDTVPVNPWRAAERLDR